MSRLRSLRWRLVGSIAVAQGVTFMVMVLAMMVVIGALWMGGSIEDGNYEGATIEVLADAVGRDGEGRLVLRPTAELVRLRSEIPDFWFVLRDDRGAELSEGRVPSDIAPLLADLDTMESARFVRKEDAGNLPVAILQRLSTAAGEVLMLTNPRGRVLLRQVVSSYLPLLLLSLVLIGLMTLATLAVTPLAVRRALTGLERAADEAGRIDIERSGIRLTTEKVAIEIAPFVAAVNGALARLDEGYERHRRFLADAAHELRTPIAILTTRVSTLPKGPDRTRLLEDASRLTILAGQLLDLQRLDEDQARFEPLDLVSIAEQVVLDLAPLAFAAGYEMAFDTQARPVAVRGDRTALERALTNLVQNAIDHGGRRGTITLEVGREGWVEVGDEGNGIRGEDQDHIFEPFHRLHPGGKGAGLGLDLVRRIMRLHGGRADVSKGRSGGACFRLTFRLESLERAG